MAGRKSGETLLLLRDFVTSCEFFFTQCVSTTAFALGIERASGDIGAAG